MKKRFLCLLLALALAVPLAALAADRAASAGPSSSWSAACETFILDEGYRSTEQTWSSAPSFALHDMDGDGIPELLASSGTGSGEERTAYVYTAVYDQLRFAGNAGIYGPADHYASGSGYPGLYCLGGRGDLHQGVYYTLKNGQVVSEPVLTITPNNEVMPVTFTITQITGDADLFDLFFPRGTVSLWTAPGTVLTFRTADQIRAMGWDDFVSASLLADNTLFRDVSLSHWAWPSVSRVCRQGLMTGVGGGCFAPSALISQAEVITILYRLEGRPGVTGSGLLPDLPDNAWYASAARWAAEIGIIGSDTFRPGDSVERQELIRMLYFYARYKNISTPATVAIFSDWDKVRDDCVEAMYWSVGAGLVNGSGDGRLDPTGSLTRAQLAAMIDRFCENVLG